MIGVGGEWHIYQVFCWWLLHGSIVAVNEFNICTLRFGLSVKGDQSIGGSPKMLIKALNRVGHFTSW